MIKFPKTVVATLPAANYCVVISRSSNWGGDFYPESRMCRGILTFWFQDSLKLLSSRAMSIIMYCTPHAK